MVQFGSLLAVVLILALYPARMGGTGFLTAGLALYAAAKGLELADREIFLALGQTVSGHTLKHLVAAAGVACLVAMLRADTESCGIRTESERLRGVPSVAGRVFLSGRAALGQITQRRRQLMPALGRIVASSGLALAIAGGASIALAQGRGEATDVGSMVALTAEVRELRLAVQQLAQTQSQTQALGVYLSVQQSRLLQVSSQLDSARKELDTVAGRSNELATRLADLEEELPRVSDPTQRNAIQGASREMKRERALASAQEEQARNRELELSQALQAEESRWSALLTRLEALIQR